MAEEKNKQNKDFQAAPASSENKNAPQGAQQLHKAEQSEKDLSHNTNQEETSGKKSESDAKTKIQSQTTQEDALANNGENDTPVEADGDLESTPKSADQSPEDAENIKGTQDSQSTNETATPKKTAENSSAPQQSSTETESSAPLPQENAESQSATDNAVTSAQNEEEEDEDEENEDTTEEIPMKPYDEMNLDALSEELERLLKNHPVKKIRQHVREIKAEFDLKFGEEHKEKKEKFLNDGGNIIDFSYSTPAEKKFNKLYFQYKESRDDYYKQVRKNLQENLERRLGIIEALKAMTGAGNDMNANFRKFRQLQDRWRKAGPVPRADYKDTWNTYHYHVERFYEFLHLDREFREMDYKHNLEQKLKMIARAEELIEETNINRAFRELQNLHRMWKEEVGPVAQQYREPIWEKFSAATKKIHENRRAYYEERDKKREEHLETKRQIIADIEALQDKPIKSHHQAQKQIKAHKALRDKFFNAGRVPRKHNKEIWQAFKTASREFNHRKNEFYKQRKKDQKENLRKKMELIEVAETHQNSDDFESVTPLMKKIQADWKKIGFVERRKSDKIWKRFKKACNHYFDRLHERQDEKNKVALEAFEEKKKLLEAVKSMELKGNREEDLPKIKAQIETWKTIGAVPKNKKHIEKQFNKALDKLFDQLDMNRKETEMLKYENRLQRLENADDENKIYKEAAFLRKKINSTKDEVRQLETNLEFFSNADKDNPLMKEAYKNIERHKQQLKIWEAKLEKLKRL